MSLKYQNNKNITGPLDSVWEFGVVKDQMLKRGRGTDEN